MTVPALTDAERQVVDAALLWVIDQTCSSALAALEEAVEELIRARREARELAKRAA